MLFHTGISSFSGGFIGVDVFFVLSGFLVTQLLLRDIARGGSIRFARFYSRRFRRLLPAAFVTLVVTGLVFTAIAPASEVAAVVGSFKAAFLYVANLYFIRHSQDYFGAGITANPVIQFWSLAVEEQFYLVWPLALGGAYFLTRRLSATAQLRTIRVAVVAGGIASVDVGARVPAHEPEPCLLRNRVPGVRAPRGRVPRAHAGLRDRRAEISAMVADSRRRSARSGSFCSRRRGCISTRSSAASSSRSSACVLLVAIEAADGGPVKRLLSTRPVVYLGQISYGTYLWHWIVIIVAVRTFQLSPITTLAVTCLVGNRAGFTQLRDSRTPDTDVAVPRSASAGGDRVRTRDHGRGRARADPENRRPGPHDEAQSARRLGPRSSRRCRRTSTSTFRCSRSRTAWTSR